MKLKKITQCELALSKLINYGHLHVGATFYLCTLSPELQKILNSYHHSRNLILKKYGDSDDGKRFLVRGEENVSFYNKEMAELHEQEVHIEFLPEKITLCIESIDKTDRELPPEKRLGFSANDWSAIREIIKVVEAEG